MKDANPLGRDEDFFVPKREARSRPDDVPVTQADTDYFRKKLMDALDKTDKMDLIKQTFEELGIPGFRPLRNILILRTHPMPVRTGAIFLPTKLTSFYGELPHMQPITATVVAAGPKAVCKVGDHVAFMRLHFAAWQRCEDGTMVGWIGDEVNILGWVDLDAGDTFADLRVESATARRMH